MEHTPDVHVCRCTKSASSNGHAAWAWCTSCCRTHPCMLLHATMLWMWIRISFENTTFNASLKEGAKNLSKTTMTIAIQYLYREKKLKLCRCREIDTHKTSGRVSTTALGQPAERQEQGYRPRIWVLPQQEAQSQEWRIVVLSRREQVWKELVYRHSEVVKSHSFHYIWDFSELAPAVSVGEACRNPSMDMQRWMS